MADHFKQIYSTRTADYDRLVAREDESGNLLPLIRDVVTLDGKTVVELGAGTGRLTRLLAPHVAHIHACDIAHPMLLTGRGTLPNTGNWSLAVAANERLPFANAIADIAIAGWSLGHATGWNPHGWRGELAGVLNDMRRVLRPGGTIMILETLGTNQTRPAPPSDGLHDYYTWLTDTHGFQHAWARTDFRFASLEEAVELIGFFFGDAMAAQVRDAGRTVVPECTGLWWQTH